MAVNKNTVKTEAVNKMPEKTVRCVESVYLAAELVNNAQTIFGKPKEVIVAALKNANITECTVIKAKEIVAAFTQKEVR